MDGLSRMVDFESLSWQKQFIQLRMCLSLGTQQVLEHMLQMSLDSICLMKLVLHLLQKHIKGRSNEAIHCCAFSSYTQVESEPWQTFLYISSLSGYIDKCTAHSKECEEVWIKHGILTGVRNEELVQQVISLDASCTLWEEVREQVSGMKNWCSNSFPWMLPAHWEEVRECWSYEAMKSTTSALWAIPSA